MEPPKKKSKVSKEKLQRCLSWIQEQNGGSGASGLSADLFDTENFVESFKSEPSSVPPGIDGEVDAVAVPVNRLKIDNLRMECGWRDCGMILVNYEKFQAHVINHMPSENSEDRSSAHYHCLWDSCGHTTADYEQLLRHVNYHSYHAQLLAIGLNARATLNLMRCKKDSRQRNKMPELLSKHVCLWIDCTATFNSMPEFLAHSHMHVKHELEHRCRWGGCGARASRRSLLKVHLRIHTHERVVACYHCGHHFANCYKLTEHVQRQNSENTGFVCNMCGASAGSPALLRHHEQSHIAMHACLYCDMSLPTLYTLGAHVRQRHTDSRPYACHLCTYASKTKNGIRRHLEVHQRQEKKKEKELRKASRDPDGNESSSDSEPLSKMKKRNAKREYCCHMCADLRIYARGSSLTKHLVKEHGIQLPFGHPRFRYQISEDGMYRLTTTRYESLEVSQKIMERQSIRRPIDGNSLDVKITEIVEATKDHPKQIVLSINNKESEETNDEKPIVNESNVEITMCDVDEFGNLIKQKFLNSDPIIFDETDYKNINQY